MLYLVTLSICHLQTLHALSLPPSFRTSASTRKHTQELAMESTPKNVVHGITKQAGGKVQAKGAAYLPRDRQQVANFRRAVAKPKDSNVLYSIVLECKLAQGKGMHSYVM